MEVLRTMRKNLLLEIWFMNSVKMMNKRSTFQRSKPSQHHPTTMFNHLVVQPAIYILTSQKACLSIQRSQLIIVSVQYITRTYVVDGVEDQYNYILERVFWLFKPCIERVQILQANSSS